MDHDFALLGIDANDVYLAGPFASALAAVQLLARDLAAAQEFPSVGVLQHDATTQRAVLMLATELPDGSYFSTSYLLIPVPRVEGREDIYQITDLGLWENELCSNPRAD